VVVGKKGEENMGIPGNSRFPQRARYRLTVLFLLLLASLAILAHTGCGGDDGRVSVDPAFQAAQTELQACLEPGPAGEAARDAFSHKYQVPRERLEPFGAANMDIHEAGVIACKIEVEFLAGALAWRIFSEIDHWTLTRDCGTVDDYCIEHARVCNHWQWYKGCLEPKFGSRCFWH
jgi:hypothetical protein